MEKRGIITILLIGLFLLSTFGVASAVEYAQLQKRATGGTATLGTMQAGGTGQTQDSAPAVSSTDLEVYRCKQTRGTEPPVYQLTVKPVSQKEYTCPKGYFYDPEAKTGGGLGYAYKSKVSNKLTPLLLCKNGWPALGEPALGVCGITGPDAQDAGKIIAYVYKNKEDIPSDAQYTQLLACKGFAEEKSAKGYVGVECPEQIGKVDYKTLKEYATAKGLDYTRADFGWDLFAGIVPQGSSQAIFVKPDGSFDKKYWPKDGVARNDFLYKLPSEKVAIGYVTRKPAELQSAAQSTTSTTACIDNAFASKLAAPAVWPPAKPVAELATREEILQRMIDAEAMIQDIVCKNKCLRESFGGDSSAFVSANCNKVTVRLAETSTIQKKALADTGVAQLASSAKIAGSTQQVAKQTTGGGTPKLRSITAYVVALFKGQ